MFLLTSSSWFYTLNVFRCFFEVDDCPTEVPSQEQKEVLKPVKEGPTQRLGRQPLWLKYPEIVPSAMDFIKQQSFAAHARRRESTGTGTEVDTKQDNQYFLFARVNYCEELCSKFHEEGCFYTSDDMNKLRMGPSTAVSRYHQQNRFFMRNNTPNLWDHDFPHARYQITTSGYQMQVKKEVCDKQSNQDNEIYMREYL